MSDDNRAYTEGSAQQYEIRKIMKQLEDIKYGDDAKALFNKYSPDGQGGISLKMKEGMDVDTEMTTQTTAGHADRFAKYMSDKEDKTFTVTDGSVEGPSFDLDLNGEKYEGGSYIISKTGDIINMSLPNNPVYANTTMLEGKKEDVSGPENKPDGKIDSIDYLAKRNAAIKKAKGEMPKGKVKEYNMGNNESLALTFRDRDEFERAKKHFESNSDFYPEDINDEFRSFQFKVEDQADADSTEYYLTQELEGTTDLQGYYFSMEPSSLSEDLDLGHEDNEPHMVKSELYRIGKYAMELYQMVDQFEGQGEVDFPAWWQSKITTATNMISSAKHYLEFELKEPAIDNAVSTLTDETPMMEAEIGKDEILAGKIMKALKDMANKDASDQHNLKQARIALNKGNMDAAKKIAKPYLSEKIMAKLKKPMVKEETAEGKEWVVWINVDKTGKQLKYTLNSKAAAQELSQAMKNKYNGKYDTEVGMMSLSDWNKQYKK
jgi:hypothetical protein